MHSRYYLNISSPDLRLDNKGNVKVGDFGLAEDMYSIGYIRDTSKTLKVPYKWMAPESLQEGLFSEHSDVVGGSMYSLHSCTVHAAVKKHSTLYTLLTYFSFPSNPDYITHFHPSLPIYIAYSHLTLTCSLLSP